jgi:dTDP-4-dehydrorhamnose reductase
MGPTLAVLAHRAAEMAKHPLKVIAVSRFRDGRTSCWLQQRNVATLSCDLLDWDALRQLPESENIIHLVGHKFGTGTIPSATWAMNTLVPAHVAERFPRARIVALSTGNVYPLAKVSQAGALETDAVTPVGEYANSTVGRERILEYYSSRDKSPLAILRLCYAVELRYGVVVDIAQKVYAGEPVDLTNGYFNCIWQGDANDMILRSISLADSPPTVWNLCCPEVFSVRTTATHLGELLERKPIFQGVESPDALLANPARICAKLGEPTTPKEVILRWIAYWVKSNGRTLGKPTRFEVRDGKY